MRNPVMLATILIAVCAVSTPASAQKVYKCGNTYSQIPCGGGKTLETSSPNAASSIAQKKAVDKENKRQMDAAKALEKARLAQEAEAMKHHQAQLKTMEEEKAKGAGGNAAPAPLKNKKPPEFFTAKQAAAAKP